MILAVSLNDALGGMSLLAMDVGGGRQRLSVTRRQCFMLLVAGLLPILCSLFQMAVFSLFHRLIQQTAPCDPLGKVLGVRSHHGTGTISWRKPASWEGWGGRPLGRQHIPLFWERSATRATGAC